MDKTRKQGQCKILKRNTLCGSPQGLRVSTVLK